MKLIRIVAEAIMGSAEYRPPQDPARLIADFYTLGMMAHGPQYITSIHQDGLDHEFKEVERTLLPYMREHLLQMAGYSICCELRHAYDSLEGVTRTVVTRQFKKIGLPQPFMKLLAKYAKADEDQRPEYQEVIEAIGGWQNMPKIAAGAASVFYGPASFPWMDEYGGKPWADACDAWTKLYNSHNIGDMYVYIDKMYDLQHNNGALLDKNETYADGWLDRMLDIKLNAKEPEELIQHCSGYMRKLSMFILKAQHGRGWDHEHPLSNQVAFQDFIPEFMHRIEMAANDAGVSCSVFNTGYKNKFNVHMEGGLKPATLFVVQNKCWVEYGKNKPIRHSYPVSMASIPAIVQNIKDAVAHVDTVSSSDVMGLIESKWEPIPGFVLSRYAHSMVELRHQESTRVVATVRAATNSPSGVTVKIATPDELRAGKCPYWTGYDKVSDDFNPEAATTAIKMLQQAAQNYLQLIA